MATYAIGDIQGCFEPLQRLLKKVDFNPHKDKLWLAGDMVHRGHDSLGTLRFLYEHRSQVTAVLGNHDLHLLAIAHGAKRLTDKEHDLAKILRAKDADTLLGWLQKQPLMVHKKVNEKYFSMVHAGIPPIWSMSKALELAGEVHKALQDPAMAEAFFFGMYGNEPHKWSDHLIGVERLRSITNYFTRMRFCKEDGTLDLVTKQGPLAAHHDYHPWFSFKNRKTKNDRIIFGHWAALEGEANTKNVYALDTGCVWGGYLTAMKMEDESFYCADCPL
ncbi:symmetrical bis(5'-nucleosyl)-tetraphosphatase [Microbulbifer agarilyticus]|uniref:symmetrical bis(5'-nucleosyl)-tetraphosphatase n=1 Tax=Microbulbifer agarilyticus TaxID=260552 RepID=UPI001C94D9A8|nr:symmetrical bis(5'-nucleosyl)-tetraphosphatase [Microbulbifer agarilyticus]MBY6210092.1 symmetrical bis(5'-nucleosyl)-tetraphosphatase [Microbulbifer agarilyticus]